MTGNTVEIDADIAVMVKMLIFEGKILQRNNSKFL